MSEYSSWTGGPDGPELEGSKVNSAALPERGRLHRHRGAAKKRRQHGNRIHALVSEGLIDAEVLSFADWLDGRA